MYVHVSSITCNMCGYNDHVIIVAGGKGKRMGGDLPKQFLPLGGIPLLMRTIMRFQKYDAAMRIILVLPENQRELWRKLCHAHNFDMDLATTSGGETRFHSVRNGLRMVPDGADGVVGVHDGVRPFVPDDVIRRCYEAARTNGAAIPVTPVLETLRHVSTRASATVPRSEYCTVQTPQAFNAQLLKKAYGQPFSTAFTDDASVVESMGCGITLVEGSRENIKITTPFDMVVAEALLSQKTPM